MTVHPKLCKMGAVAMIPQLNIESTLKPLYSAFLEELRQTGFSGEIRTDYSTRLVASTDNSVYQIVPEAVVFPRNRQDVVEIARLAGRERYRAVRMMPRGGGTGTNGGSLGTGLCIDVSKYLNRILDLDLEAGLVRVEPGVILDQLNDYLRPHGVFFAPHVAPSDRATLGGMISNDSCGQGSRLYGRTSRHIESLDLVLGDGDTWTTRLLDAGGCEDGALPERIERARRTVAATVRDHADAIRERFPVHDRFLTGYDLAHASRDGDIDLAALVAGSEGTLAFVVGAALRVTQIPSQRRLAVAMYDSFDRALAAAGPLLAFEPSAIETIDQTVLDLAREDMVWRPIAQHFDDAPTVRALNLIELCDGSEERLSERLDRLAAVARGAGAVRVVTLELDSQAKAFWALRNRGVGLLGNLAGARRPVPFVEDCAVPPQRLVEFVGELRDLLDGHGLKYGMYGHVDVGCLHVRPALDLREAADRSLLRKVSDRVFALVQSYGGVFWGEHGKGLRSEYNRDVFGPELYQEIRKIKEAFDPYDQMNPGKVAAPATGRDSLATIDGAEFRGRRDSQIAAAAQADYETALACNGNGACFTRAPDRPMCPSMKASGDRIHSPKGRATLMREWLRQLSIRGWDGASQEVRSSVASWADPRRWLRRRYYPDDFSHEVFEAFAGCLSCKACVAECPVHVDIPNFKSRFLNAYYQRYPRPISDYLIAAMEASLPDLSPTLVNAVSSALGRAASGSLGLVDLPELAQRSALNVLGSQGAELVDWGWRPDSGARGRTVALIPDAFTNFFDPGPFLACFELLRVCGVRVVVLPYSASGKSQHVKGFVSEFRETAARNSARLARIAAAGVELVCVEPAIALMFRQEYSLVGSRAGVALPQEWLASNLPSWPEGGGASRYALLGHCTESTTAAEANELWSGVFAAAGVDLEMPEVGCCGMAGAYGHEKRHVDDSRRIFELSWQRRIRSLNPAEVLATGYSCRAQVARFAGFMPRHPLEILRDRMNASSAASF